MQKWEYKKGTDLDELKMNELGEEGWELVSATNYGNRVVFHFNRPKP